MHSFHLKPLLGLIDATVLASGNRHVRNKLWLCVCVSCRRRGGDAGGDAGMMSRDDTEETINPLEIVSTRTKRSSSTS